MTRWFRHYAGMARDDKLVRVALRSKQSIERVVWVWSVILESASEIDDAGLFDVDAAEIAYFLRADEADICSILAALTDAGHLVENRVARWGDRQFQSDRSASRQATYRERKRQRDGGNKKSDAGVTSLSRHGDAPETETEYTLANAKDADASPPTAKERLWTEGKPMLVALGVPAKQSGSIIGRWLKDARDDAQAVLSAITRARDQCPHDPIPWITATLKQDARNGKRDISSEFRNAFNRIDERLDALG